MHHFSTLSKSATINMLIRLILGHITKYIRQIVTLLETYALNAHMMHIWCSEKRLT